jgi:hypothetical protein
LCHACQLGRHVGLPFPSSSTRALQPFDLVHCDLWTSPVPSVSGYKYYLIILNDCTHYSWTFLLRQKSDTFPTLSHFFAFVSTQFGHTIRSIQCNNGREFDNSSTRTFFLSHDVQLRMSCPYTFPQNGKAEHMICTTNSVMRSLLFQASFPARYWAESLYTATYILNLLPTKSILATTPYFALFGTKLAPHSCRCVFLGYSSNHKGYRCLDLTMNHLLISRHVIFGESSFPFASSDPPPDDLDSLFLSSPVICPIAPPYPSYIPGTLAPGVPATTSSPRVRPSVYHPVAIVRDPRSTHPMVTRRAAGVTKPVDRLQLSAAATPQTLSPVPTFVRSMLVDPHWRHAMEEYEALLSNSTWDLVPQPPGANVVTAKWIFKHKLKKDGSLEMQGSLGPPGLHSLPPRWTTTRPSVPSSSLPPSKLC